MKNFYAVRSPRGFANELEIHIFGSRSDRDAAIIDDTDEYFPLSRITAENARRVMNERDAYHHTVDHRDRPAPGEGFDNN